MSAYESLAACYDELTYDIPYEKTLTFFERLCAQEHVQPHSVLDLACGTGKLTLELLRRGADVIGTDLSPEMLAMAQKNCARKGFSPLLLLQDMRELDLYGTVDVAVCATNSLNYLQNGEELRTVFSKVQNFLTPGGLFFRYKQPVQV